MNVTQKTKDIFLDTNSTKHLVLKIINSLGTTTVDESIIIGDTMVLNESILPSGELTFGGGIPSSFEIQLFSMPDYLNIKGETIKLEASIYAVLGDDTSETIPLFKGYINEIKINPMNLRVTLKAYDCLYNEYVNCEGDTTNENFVGCWGQKRYEDETYKERYGNPYLVDIVNDMIGLSSDILSNWDDVNDYLCQNQITDYCNMDKLPSRGDTGEYFYIGAENVDDPNKEDGTNYSAKISKNYMCKMEIVQHLLQLNNMFLKNDRTSYVAKGVGCYLDTQSNTIKKTDESAVTTDTIPYYKSVSYDNLGSPSDTVQYQLIFLNSDGKSERNVFYPDGTTSDETLRTYVKNNLFVDQPIAWWKSGGHGSQVMASIPFMSAMNYTITCQGRPWLEVGEDAVQTSIRSGVIEDDGSHEWIYIGGILCTRTLKGIQNLEDTYSFTSAIEPSFSETRATIGSRLSNLEKTRPMTQYVTEKPENFDVNTIYFVRKS